MSQAAHTPTPWYADRLEHVVSVRASLPDDGEFTVFTTEYSSADDPQLNDANAAHIVRCVNSHSALVEALRSFALSDEYWQTLNVDKMADTDTLYSWPVSAYRRVRAALALSETKP